MDNEMRVRLSAEETQDEVLVHALRGYYTTYKNAMTSTLTRYRRNERYLQMRDWDGVLKEEPNDPQPITPVLFSSKENLLADIVESRPTINVAAETAGMAETARKLTDIGKYYLDRRDFARSYAQAADNALIYGPFILEVCWDPLQRFGAGDISIKDVSPLCFLADPNVEDINESAAVIKTAIVTNSRMREMYPEKAAALTAHDPDREEQSYQSDDKDRDKCEILDCWWRELDEDGIYHVHFARITGSTLLEKRLDVYGHGRYPFAVAAAFRVPGHPFGMGLYDLFADTQSIIDVLDQAVTRNALRAGRPKKLVSRRANADINALLDDDREVVECDGIGEELIRYLSPPPYPSAAAGLQVQKQEMLKEESGQNQFARGEGGKGITAASAINALQEAGGKRSRLVVQRIYAAVQEAAEQMISIAAQYLTPEDVYTITNDMGEIREVAITAVEQSLPGYTQIEQAVSIKVEADTNQHSLVMNELVQGLINSGALRPAVGLAMMNIPNKGEIVRAVQEQDALMAQLQQMQAQIQQLQGALTAQEEQMAAVAAKRPALAYNDGAQLPIG